MYNPQPNRWLTPVIVIFSTLILWVDIVTPRGSAEYIFYFLPVALTIYHHRSDYPIRVAISLTFLSLIGWYYSPMSQIQAQVNLRNRIYSLITMWGVSYLAHVTIIARNNTYRDKWLKGLATKLLDSVRGELSTKEIADKILTFLAKEIHILLGVVYIRNERDDLYEFTASYGVDTQSVKTTIKDGEGITGQVAVDQEIINITELPGDYLKVKTALGTSTPGAIKIVPLIADGKTIGLMELAFKEHPSASIKEFFKINSENLAIAIRSATHKEKLVRLLQESQQLTEELQAQQEELRVVNEELEQQARALKESHSRLESQQTEMEQTNQQLEEQAQTLENQKSQLDERNKDLLHVQVELKSKAQELERSGKYKSEFLANMSHELRTPLNSTLILAKLLAENKAGNLNEEQIKYAEIIYHSGSDLLNLINDILDLSKVEAGKLTISTAPIFTNSIIKSLDDMFTPLAKNKQLNLRFIAEADSSEFISDRQRVEQILKNFLSNALKFTSQGEVTVHIYKKEHQIYFEVKDTGIGIAPEQQQIIFEAFRQADGTTNRKFGGTGLGLSISKELAKLLGGEILLQSKLGEGSVFTLCLPVKLDPQKMPDVKAQSLPSSNSSTIQSPTELLPVTSLSFQFQDDKDQIQNFSRKMLIIEDDEAFAKILFDLAHEMNFGALVAPTAQQGIELAKNYLPHAIVLDVKLPDHSGMIVLDQLKMNPKTRHIPVHVISSEDLSRLALEMGASGYMLKPVKREKLQEVFKNLTSLMEQKNKEVLVIEDDQVQKNYIVNLISDIQVHVDAVDTCALALEKLSHKTYDCMIMDLSLPDMSGYEFLDQLSHQNSHSSYPPVIVYTARDLTSQEEEKLRQYSESIIIKGAKSPERLLSEVTLFLHRIETQMPPERQKMLTDLRSREKSLQERKILIVDDDVRNIFALTSALESMGAQIVTARNGLEALEKLEKLSDIELVLMDIMMPYMDGYEAIERIRQIKKFENLPILALTAKAMSDDKEKSIAAGASDYLSKPIEMEKLLSLIKVWLPAKRKFNN